MGQLVLTRRAGEKLRIGEDIVITILQTGNQVKVGIDAPPAPVRMSWRRRLRMRLRGCAPP